jgi:precorrin-6Y C5,15-methyltransferase (decarboxylating)
MDEIIEKISELLVDDGVIVFNSVSEESRRLFLNAIAKYNLQLRQTIRIQTDDFNSIDVMKATK